MSPAGVCCALVAFKFESDKRASTGKQMVHDDDEAVDSSHFVSDLGMRITMSMSMSMPILFPLADPSVRRVTQI